jgi:hypothetical protein
MKHSRRNFIKISSTAVGAIGVAPLWAEKAPQVTSEMYPPEGNVTVSPSEGTAREYGTWTVTYKVGKSGIRTGGGVRVQLPDSWHAGIRNSANRLQASNPEMDNYVTASSSRAGVRLRIWVEDEPGPEVQLVKDSRRGLDWRMGRYIYVTRVWVVEGNLQEGDVLSVVYGDTIGGSRGMQSGIISTRPEPIMLAVDTDGTGHFRMHPDRPTLVTHAGPAAELFVSGPSSLVLGQPAELLISVVDAHQNPADSFEGEVKLNLLHGQAEMPATVSFVSKRGWERIRIIPKATGIIRLQASGDSGRLFSTGNPMKVFTREPNVKIFWGDLHSHTHYSVDGVGHNNFEYARDISGLDFYAMTDHSCPLIGEYAQGLGPDTPHVWAEYNALTDKYYEPGKFATLHAYECSLEAPYGHHNVYFRGGAGAIRAEGDVSLTGLWDALRAGQALTIPHHTGKMPIPIIWYPHNPELDRNIEIYSAHGSSETYDPEGPLSFERSMFTSPSKSARGPQYAVDAWIEGLQLSVIASSDDHRARPGQPQYGLAAVTAPDLTREAIFDGLYNRRTYGTTGAKILLEFSIDGQPMGQQVSISGSPRLSLEAHGTDLIDRVEVMRYSKSDGAFKIRYILEPRNYDITWTQTDEEFKEDSIYYVRLRQAGLVRERIAMAWSSPIWVKRAMA